MVNYNIGDAFDVAGLQFVAFAFFDKVLVSVDNQYIGIGAVLSEHQNHGRNACAKKDIGGQAPVPQRQKPQMGH